MVVLVIVQLLTIAMFLLFGWLILKKEMYGLISGFAMKSEEEQQELINNGYPQASAKGLLNSGYILLIGLILALFKVPFVIELSWAVMLVYLFGYLLYINKLETKKVRKRNFLLLMATIVFTFAIIGGAFYVGQSSNVLTISKDELHISGTYGVDWQLEEITNIELVEELPEIKMRTNGYSFGGRLKGRFRLEELGTGRLFIYRDNPPFIYIEKSEDYLFINSKQQQETLLWYEAAKEALR